ncbi:PIF1-like helicase [Chrysochromulina ericina virus CeV-01B]|uniref:PIF1-like helicase n=1 Tax=Chrysochromulina ericina virus CeV-01B TaxID=3070830 RepID=A0A0N9QZ70_9VIRU|nr:exonuclease V [Chrysochromulina ericina virus]ALH23384.1 PIF1-like helicase [Chrysochromulina ericina virus CeV-01B]
MYNLNNQQQDIFDKYLKGENIFITGPGGTGKTYLIKAIVEDAKKNNKAYHVCALTGCAAILLQCGATTLHGFSGIGLASGTISQVVDRVVKNRYKKPNWAKTELLIVDEVSMLSLKIFTIIDLIAKRVKRQRDIPFGGMQIIFAGDFYQLPPVGDEEEIETTQFCFESPLWNEVFPSSNQIVLETIFRQTDNNYAKILNKLRVGEITKNGIKALEQCVNKKFNDELNPTILLPRRKDVDNINIKEYNKLDKISEKTYTMKPVDMLDLPLSKEHIQNITLFTDTERQQEIDYLADNLMAEKTLNLRIGTIVMCISNLDVEAGIINGSQGIVVDFQKDNPLVKFNDGNVRVIIPHIWQSEKLPAIAVQQLPLIYAWAITIHKAQGVTLDKALIDIGEEIFECGQTYVALSRIKTLEGLYLKNFDFTKIKVNKKVQEFYKILEN